MVCYRDSFTFTYAGFEVGTDLVMKGSVFWDITAYNPFRK
jgi:hypothetical protein